MRVGACVFAHMQTDARIARPAPHPRARVARAALKTENLLKGLRKKAPGEPLRAACACPDSRVPAHLCSWTSICIQPGARSPSCSSFPAPGSGPRRTPAVRGSALRPSERFPGRIRSFPGCSALRGRGLRGRWGGVECGDTFSCDLGYAFNGKVLSCSGSASPAPRWSRRCKVRAHPPWSFIPPSSLFGGTPS